MLGLCATNAKVQKRTLQLLAREDKKLQQEKNFHETQGHKFVPTPVQVKNKTMWEDAKTRMPDAAAAAEKAEAAPHRRERMTDIFRHQMEMQERLMQVYTQPNVLDTALMHMLAQFGHSAEAQQTEVLPPMSPATFQSPTRPAQQPKTKRERLEELQQLFNDGVISKEDLDKARMHILTND